MIHIRNYRVFPDVHVFNPLTQEMSPQLENINVQQRTCGLFTFLGDTRFVLYRQQTLMLLIGNKNYIFDDLYISTNTISRLPSQGHEIYFLRHIEIYYRNKIIFERDYKESGPYFENDDTPMVESEHFDFGLFLENLFKDKGRSERIFTDL